MQHLFLKKNFFAISGIVLIGFISGCTHMAGTVEWQDTNKPVAGAIISIGQPGGDFVFGSHTTDAHGAFSFDIISLDTDDVWVWSGQGDPVENSVHVDPDIISDHMVIQISQ